MFNEEVFPDLSDLLKNKIINRYITASLTGFVQEKGLKFEKAAAVACRLIDKVVNEYQNARHFSIKKENTESVADNIEVVNSLEDCLNAIGRIHKLFPLLHKDAYFERRSTIKYG